MKVIMIGGSSPSTPAFIRDLRLRRDVPPLEVVLLGQSRSRLARVARAARLIASGTSIRISSGLLADPLWPQTLVDAEIIILQARPGGYEARRLDEKLPLKYGVCGDQDLGPGGFSNGWRSWPHLRKFFVEAQLRSPKAIFLVVSSPVGLLVRLGRIAAPRLTIAGICELPWTTILDVCTQTGAPEQSVEFAYFGLNHLGWIYHLNFGERNLVAEYAEKASVTAGFPSKIQILKYSAIPTKYVRMHLEQGEVVLEQEQSSFTRSDYLAKYRDRAMEIFENGSIEEIEAILTERPTPWFSKAIVPFVAAVGGSIVKEPLFLSRVHGELVPGFDPGEVLEAACDVVEKEITPRPMPRRVPDELSDTIRRFMRAERLAADAIWKQSLADLAHALDAHPWTCLMHGTNRYLAQEIAARSAVDIDSNSPP